MMKLLGCIDIDMIIEAGTFWWYVIGILSIVIFSWATFMVIVVAIEEGVYKGMKKYAEEQKEKEQQWLKEM